MSSSRDLIFLAAFVMIALITSPLSAAPLSEERIAQEIIGKTLTGSRMGMTVRVIYHPDGTLKMKALFMSGEGTWRFSKTGICMDMKSGPRQGESCITFEHLGGREYRNSEGLTLTVQD